MKTVGLNWWISSLLVAGLLLSLCWPRIAGASPPPFQPGAEGGRRPFHFPWPIAEIDEPPQQPPLPDHEFLIAQGPNDLFRPAVATGGLVVWYTKGSDGMDVVGLFLEDGRTPGDPFVIAGGPGDQSVPAVAGNTKDGGYLVAWHEQRDSDTDIYARYVTADGQFPGDPFVVSAAEDDQLRPAVAYVPAADAFLVVWQDGRPRGEPDVYARVVPSFSESEAGGRDQPLGEEFAISDALGGQYIPTVACETDRSHCLVVWQDNRNAHRLFTDVVGRFVDAVSSATVGGEIHVAVEADYQYSPVVAFNPISMEYLVVWDDDICSRRVSRTGQLLDERRVNVSLESPHQYKPAVAVGEDGSYLIVWEDLRNLSSRGADVYGQWLSVTGRPLGSNFALSHDDHNQYSPTLVSGQGWGEGDFFVIWEDDRSLDGTLHLYGGWLPLGAEGE